MSVIVLTWVLLFAVFLGVGLALARLLRLRPTGADDALRCFWIGWVGALVLLQFWHLAFPVDWRPLVILALCSAVGYCRAGPDLGRAVRGSVRRAWPLWLLGLLIVARIANRAIGAPEHLDSAFYHLSAIRWAATYPIIPGLGNLHHPLGINSAYFLYVALLDVGHWAGRSHHVANGLLLCVGCVQALVSLRRVLTEPAQARPGDVFLSLCLPGLLAQAAVDRTIFSNMFVRLVASPTPDLAVFVVGALMARELITLCLERDLPDDRFGFLFVSLTALCLGGLIAKVSFAAFGGAAFLGAFVLWAIRSRKTGRPLWCAGMAAVLVLGFAAEPVWMVRSVILSGYVAYPSPVPSVPVAWRIPRSIVAKEAAYTRRHARWPSEAMAARAEQVEGRSPDQWFGSWLRAVSRVAPWSAVVPCVLALAACVAGAVLRLRGGRARAPWLEVAPFGAALVIAGILWFLAAPNPRFAGALFWCVGAGAWAAIVHGLRPELRGRWTLVVGALSLALSVCVLGAMTLVRPGPDGGLHPGQRITMQTFVTRHGLEVLVPAIRQAGPYSYCWNAPLPCTPRPDPDLRLRRPGNLRSGFLLDSGPPPH